MAVVACQRGVHAEDEGYECSMDDLAPSAGEALVRGSGGWYVRLCTWTRALSHARVGAHVFVCVCACA